MATSSATPPPKRRRWFRILLIVVAVVIVATVIAGIIIAPRFQPMMRDRMVKVLQEHYAADVELRDVGLNWYFPLLRLTAEGLTMRRRDRDADQPPLMQMERVTIYATIGGVMKKPYHIRRVNLEGFRIHIPPRRDREDDNHRSEKPKGAKSRVPDFVIDEVLADGTLLVIHPKMAGKDPLDFDIEKLRLNSAGTMQPMKYRATLTNPKPPGRIQSNGSFGPWDRDEPSDTPVAGAYTFNDADLSVFPGIAGILSSQGEFKGPLNSLSVEGTTDIPDFRVSVSGNPLHLKTKFSARVDGTNGDTYLQPVTAQFLRTTLVARGKVEGVRGVKGKTIALDVNIANGRVEDLIRLAAKGKAGLTGGVNLQTKFLLPPGKEDVADRLFLNGKFGIASANFTDRNVAQKIGGLSLRAQGRAKEAQNTEIIEEVAANFKGQFVLKESLMHFSSLSFDIPGASVNLDGDYGLRSEELDFQGRIRMQAKLSQTQTGFKSILLKAVDPFFKKPDAGAELPIKITGPRSQPQFGLNLRSGKKDKAADKSKPLPSK